MHNTSIFIFRRDLRLADNSGLIAAAQSSRRVLPLFIIDPYLLNKWSEANARMTFLAHALKQLDDSIARYGGRLQVLQGDPAEVLERLMCDNQIDAVFTNRDYTPFARRRDRNLKSVCEVNGVVFHSYADQLLNEPEDVRKADGLPYQVFTPYYRKAKEYQVAAPATQDHFNFDKGTAGSVIEASSLGEYLAKKLDSQSLDLTSSFDHLSTLENYESEKDIPGMNGTSRLSALLRFGLCSVREVYHTVKKSHSVSHGLIRQLYWRDFYFQIGFNFPHVYRAAFREKYNRLRWDNNPAGLLSWQQGRTGFPIIDAGMRELMATGFMHNRVRMIVASFLCKNLLIDWRAGEAHFARLLVDFDPALNNGNWQWSASTGCDAQPYFRVFNPWRQQLRFDPDCTYIKRWIPELQPLAPRQIHNLVNTDAGYLAKVLDLKSTSEESKRRFKAASDAAIGRKPVKSHQDRDRFS